MKKAIPILLTLSIAFCAKAQVSFERQVVASAGSTESMGNLVFCYTLGETVASTAMAGNVLYTQGFHQPPASVTATKDVNFKVGYTIYPNPASRRVNIDIIANRTVTCFTLSLYTADGRLVRTGSYEISGDESITLDISGIPSATYVLSLYDPSANAFAIEPLIVY